MSLHYRKDKTPASDGIVVYWAFPTRMVHLAAELIGMHSLSLSEGFGNDKLQHDTAAFK